MIETRHAIRSGSIIAISSTDNKCYRGKYIDSDRQTRGYLSDLTVMLDSLEQAQSVLKEIRIVENEYTDRQREVTRMASDNWNKRCTVINAIKAKLRT